MKGNDFNFFRNLKILSVTLDQSDFNDFFMRLTNFKERENPMFMAQSAEDVAVEKAHYDANMVRIEELNLTFIQSAVAEQWLPHVSFHKFLTKSKYLQDLKLKNLSFAVETVWKDICTSIQNTRVPTEKNPRYLHKLTIDSCWIGKNWHKHLYHALVAREVPLHYFNMVNMDIDYDAVFSLTLMLKKNLLYGSYFGFNG